MPRGKKVVRAEVGAQAAQSVEPQTFKFERWEGGGSITLNPEQVKFGLREGLIGKPGQSPSRRTINHIITCCPGKADAATALA